jgi:predicted nucleic-acid-binding protein
MTFVDTNYFLRFLLKDNDVEHQAAKQLLRAGAEGKIKLFTSIIVFFEIYWVLASFYEKEKSEIIPILNNILRMEFVALDERPLLKNALAIFADESVEFEDAFNLAYARARRADDFKTFDKKLNKVFHEKAA